MISGIFLKIVNLSISAGWIVLAVLLLRLIFKKAPKWVSVLLWGIVAVRLVCPFSIESVFSLMPSDQTVSPTIMTDKVPSINSGIPIINSTVNPVIEHSFTPTSEASANPLQILIPILSAVWILGVALMLLYTVASYMRLKKKIGTSVPLCDNICQSEAVISPFVLGIIKPKIYLPFNIGDKEKEYVIAHERAHIKRKDHLWKPLGFLLLSVYWFNPLLWIGYILLCRDIELACDEKVVKQLDTGARADYSEALLSCSVNRKMIAACPLAFGEVGVKERVKSVLNYKKPAFWIIIVAVAAVIIASICLLTSPKSLDIKDLDDNLQVFLDMQVAKHHESERTKDNFVAVSYDLMKVKKSDNQITVYSWVLYREYSYKAGILKVESGSHIPTVITAEKEGNDYKLLEYWIPRDGACFEDDIKAKFPKSLWKRALDSQKSIDRQSAECENAAKEYFNISGITITPKPDKVYTDYKGVSAEVKNLKIENGRTVLTVKWKNDTPYEVTYGESYKIEKEENGEWVSVQKSDSLVFTAIAIILTPNSSTEKEYNLTNSFDISQSGKYRFVSDCIVREDELSIKNIKCNLYSEFNIDASELGIGISQSSNGVNIISRIRVYTYEWEKDISHVNLFPDSERFTFVLSSLADYIPAGKYEETDEYVILKDENGKDVYTFKKVGSNLVFAENMSSSLPKYAYSAGAEAEKCIIDGALFAEVEVIIPSIAQAELDIDGDGVKELCVVSFGPTSGLSTVMLSAYENGELEYFNIFMLPYREIHFDSAKAGENILVIKNQDIEKRYEIGIDGENITLTCDGEAAPYWGEQGINSQHAPNNRIE